ncbi:MAG TPA: S9 family peptidase [Ktedonobacteraceae bacterium]|nr:S9 family peptidase [Ktedonobacteraceae bacterium]
MIENDDTSTQPQPISGDVTSPAATLQIPVPAAPPATSVPAANPQSHPYMSVDDVLALRILNTPQISPDGSRIAFAAQQSDAGKNTTSSAVWLVNARGGKGETPRQLTNLENTAHDITPCWSPDGQTLAFLSDRSGSMQIHLLSLTGGEARQISRLSQGVSEYTWRPDGTALLAHSSWKAEDDQQQPDTSATAVVYTRLDEQWDGVGFKHGRRQQLWSLPLDGEAARLTSEPVDIISSCWSPDGTEIAFCANRRPDPDLSASAALWVLNVASGQMRRLSPEAGLAQMPSWSPDGQHIAYYYTEDQSEAGNISPWIVNAHDASAPRPAASNARELTCLQLIIDELHDVLLSRPQWYPDNASLLVAVQQRGQIHLYRIDTQQDQVTQLTTGNGCYLDPHVSQDGQTITVIRADWFTPGDVWAMDGDGANRRKLTGINDTFLRGRQLVRPKRIIWKSFDGLEIEGWLYLPTLPEGVKAPLILEIHGGPTLSWGDSYVHEFQVLAGKGYAVLAANPRGSMGYGEEFTRKVLNDWGGDDFRDLMAGIDHVIATEPVDGNRLGIGGLSYGGYMTDWAITQTNRFKAAVSRNGISFLPSASTLSDQTVWFDLGMGSDDRDADTLRRSCSALTFADKIVTPLLLLHSENDLRCPFSESLQLFVVLRKRKHTVELVRYPGASHLIDLPDYGTPQQRVDRLRRTVAWFERFA